jgi:hypothetical protein
MLEFYLKPENFDELERGWNFGAQPHLTNLKNPHITT